VRREGTARRAVLLAALLGLGGLDGCQRPGAMPAPGEAASPLSATALLGGGGDDAAAFERAIAPAPLVLPRDHGPHPRFRSEWWYFTGILQTPSGSAPRRFGYQFTLFRQALDPQPAARASAWAAANIYMGHLAISDLDGDPRQPRFHAFQRFARDGLDLAGARAVPFEVWVDDWRVAGPADGSQSFPVTLRARAAAGDQTTGAAGPSDRIPQVGLDLVASAGRGPILQGDRGLSQKGSAAGNASYYYSFTRLPTEGTITLGGQALTVAGTSWLDREWSTSALDAGVVGWDWMGIQLDDGRDLMVYKLRTAAGTAAPQSRATLIDRQRRTQLFGPEAFTLDPVGEWQSPDGQARYPAAMRLQIPTAKVDLIINPLLAEQELRLAVRYWEGAVEISGVADGRDVSGRGYLELTGYTSAPPQASGPRATVR